MFPKGAKSPQFRTTGLWPYKPTFQGLVFWNLFLQLFIHSFIHWNSIRPSYVTGAILSTGDSTVNQVPTLVELIFWEGHWHKNITREVIEFLSSRMDKFHGTRLSMLETKFDYLIHTAKIHLKLATMKGLLRGFPSATAVKTPFFQCRGYRFNSWSGSSDPYASWPKYQNKISKKHKTEATL